MILLYNAEAIYREVFTSARVRIATALQCPREWVTVQITTAEEGRLLSDVNVKIPDTGDIPPQYLRAKVLHESSMWAKEVIGQVMGQCNKEYKLRVEGM